MQQVFYPGHAGEPCVGEYAIALDRTDMIARADIVLVSLLTTPGRVRPITDAASCLV
ncbi:hypothetical protein [Mesorhizobium comanense]|uniref:hypothetical protein n=1 Tax=Mesorhizobium comanense TaxID=2502215 RepID=UPI0014859964|nr:hypothetical protein [Mesorhizobium comanense]